MTKLSVLLAVAAFLGCAAYTKQNLQNTARLSQGMEKEQVLSIMGSPVKTEFSGNQIAWHYCKTGEHADEFMVVVFEDGRLIRTKSYVVTVADVNGATGDCSCFVRSYQFDKPNETKDIRIEELPSH